MSMALCTSGYTSAQLLLSALRARFSTFYLQEVLY